MRNNSEGSELDLAEGVRRRYKKNSPSVLSCVGKRTRKGCNRGSEVGTVHRGGEKRVPLRKRKQCGRRGSCEKEFISKKSSGCA